MHLCAGLTTASWIMEPSGGSGANFSLQLNREHSLLKLVIENLSPKINVNKKIITCCNTCYKGWLVEVYD